MFLTIFTCRWYPKTFLPTCYWTSQYSTMCIILGKAYVSHLPYVWFWYNSLEISGTSEIGGGRSSSSPPNILTSLDTFWFSEKFFYFAVLSDQLASYTSHFKDRIHRDLASFTAGQKSSIIILKYPVKIDIHFKSVFCIQFDRIPKVSKAFLALFAIYSKSATESWYSDIYNKLPIYITVHKQINCLLDLYWKDNDML